jgi:hypothetical protein
MARKNKDRRPSDQLKPNKSEDATLAGAVVQKYTGLADRLLKSVAVKSGHSCDYEGKEH